MHAHSIIMALHCRKIINEALLCPIRMCHAEMACNFGLTSSFLPKLSRLSPTMALTRQKSQWTQKTLTATAKCQFCGNKFKPQGIKSHESCCSRRKVKEKQRIQATKEYEDSLERGMSTLT